MSSPTAESWPLWHFRATVLRVIDGDTLVAVIDGGFRITVAIEIRLLGINAPEMHTPTLDAGKASRDYLASLVAGKQLYLRTEKDHRSFTRYIGEIWIEDGLGGLVSVNDAMIASGYAVVYFP